MKKTVQMKVKTNWGTMLLSHYKGNVYLSERLTNPNYPSFAAYKIFSWDTDKNPILKGIITEDTKGFKDEEYQTYHPSIDILLERFLPEKQEISTSKVG